MSLQNTFPTGNYQWQENQQEVTPYHEMKGVFQDDSVIGFFQRHPKLILFLFEKQEHLMRMIILRMFHDYSIANALALLLGELEASTEVDNAIAALTRMHKAGEPKDVEGVPQASVTETMELDGVHFLAHILEESEEEIKQMQQHNHNMAMAHGYYHETQTPTGPAYKTPWGITHEAAPGDWQYNAVTQNQYGQQGWPPQAPGGMPNPHQRRGGLASSLIGLFGGPALLV